MEQDILKTTAQIRLLSNRAKTIVVDVVWQDRKNERNVNELRYFSI